MFDELSHATEQERMVYKPTKWDKIDVEETPASKILPMPDRNQDKEEKPQKQSDGIFSEVFGIVDYIRNIVTKNEDLVILAIIVVILADCEDNIELLIALAVLFFPSISGLIPGLFNK